MVQPLLQCGPTVELPMVIMVETLMPVFVWRILNNNWRDYFYGKVSVILTPFKDFTITGNYAPSIRNSRTKTFLNRSLTIVLTILPQLKAISTIALTTSLTEARGDTKSLTKQLLLNYKFDIKNNHHFTFMAGYEDYYYFLDTMSAAGDRFELVRIPLSR
jgi:hypothetical protein